MKFRNSCIVPFYWLLPSNGFALVKLIKGYLILEFLQKFHMYIYIYVFVSHGCLLWAAPRAGSDYSKETRTARLAAHLSSLCAGTSPEKTIEKLLYFE